MLFRMTIEIVEVAADSTDAVEVEAIGLYERFGFRRRAPFGEYVEDPLSVYFEKNIEEPV